MALSFDDNSTDLVNHGSDASVDNLSAGTVIFWYKPDDINDTVRTIVGQGDWGVGTGWRIFRPGVGGGGGQVLRCLVNRATANQEARSNAVIVADTWQYIGFSWSIAAGGPKVYRGTLTALAADVTDAGNSADGVGVYSADAAGDLIVGDVESIHDDYCMDMDFAFCALFDTVLTQAQIQAQQFRPHVTAAANCVLFAHYGFNGALGTVADWSGSGNNGTPVGTVVADHVPLGPPFGFGIGWVEPAVAAPPAAITVLVLAMNGVHSVVFGGQVVR